MATPYYYQAVRQAQHEGRRILAEAAHIAEHASAEVSVEMIGGSRGQSDLGTAEVVWVRTQEAGLKFGRAGTGRTSLLNVVAQAEAAKSATAEIAHAAACACRHGEGPAEPALPASAYRKAEAR